MSTFDEESFKKRVEESLKLVSNILEKNRNPLYPSDCSHKYDDKYFLVQSLYVPCHFVPFLVLTLRINTALVSQVNCLDVVCSFGEHLDQLLRWNRERRAVTLGVGSEQKITYSRVEKKVLESSRVVCFLFCSVSCLLSSYLQVKENQGIFGRTGTKGNKHEVKQRKYFWKYSLYYEFYAYPSNKLEEKVALSCLLF